MQSDWETATVQENRPPPPAVIRLLSPAETQGQSDSLHSQVECEDEDPDEHECEEPVMHQREDARQQVRNAAGHVRVVKDLSLSFFRAKLVQHFDIAFQKNEIVWPGKRNSRLNFPPPI